MAVHLPPVDDVVALLPLLLPLLPRPFLPAVIGRLEFEGEYSNAAVAVAAGHLWLLLMLLAAIRPQIASAWSTITARFAAAVQQCPTWPSLAAAEAAAAFEWMPNR